MERAENINILDYKIEIERVADDDGGGYIATIPELGCIGDGDTVEEAINDVREVAENLIKIAKEDGKDIPAPQSYKHEEDYSGRLTLRIPKTLHKMLSLQAEKEGCSINQLIIAYISMGIGNEFGKNQVSIINIDASPYIIEGLIKEQWKELPNSIPIYNKRELLQLEMS